MFCYVEGDPIFWVAIEVTKSKYGVSDDDPKSTNPGESVSHTSGKMKSDRSRYRQIRRRSG